MSKKVSLIVISVILMLALVIPSSKVYAANKKVNEVNASQANGKITVSGTVEDGMLAVAVQIVDSNGKLVTLETGEVDKDNKYNLVIEVPEGTYTVKVADYEGGAVVEKEVTTEKKTEETTKEDEKTSEEKTEEKTEDTSTEAKTEESKATGAKDETPQTGDTIRNTFIALAVAILALTVTFKFKKNKVTRKH